MRAGRTILAVGAALALAAGGMAQPPTAADRLREFANGNEDDGPYVRMEGGGFINEDTVRTARETQSHSTGTPNWTNPPGFEKDVFTFARIVFKVAPNSDPGYGRGRRIGWWVDYPDADLNFSYRLQQMTSTRVDPNGRVLKLTDPDLHNYPFIFMEHPGYMRLKPDEIAALRKYLLAGGALVAIDFWNQSEWNGFEAQMKQVMPERTWTELDVNHPLFNCVFELKGPLSRLQVPTMQFWRPNEDLNESMRPYTHFRGAGSEEMHVRAWLDDKQRIMALAIHNSDVPDAWEREGENDAYFRRFSERIAYPLGINLLFYLMTH